MDFIINRYANVLSQDEYNTLKMIVKNLKWEYSGQSIEGSSGNKFWFSDLSGNPFFTDFFLERLQELTKNKYILDKVYANGQTLGQDGGWHTDSDFDNRYTFLYYYNDCMDISLIGDTYFKDDDDIPLAVSPVPNSAILFNHTIPHYGAAPKQAYNDLRVTIAFKLTELSTT